MIGAAFLIPVRKWPYDMIKGTASIDRRLKGSCVDCLSKATDFQKDKERRIAVDVDNKDLVYRLDE